MDTELPCQEHKENTCCKVSDIKRIYTRMAAYEGTIENVEPVDDSEVDDPSQMTAPPMTIDISLSKLCKQLTSEIFCTVCDGDIGTHRRRGLCPELCQSWHFHCSGEAF